jgi:ATP-binding cassette subfamily B multidrug efflux pump
VNASPAVTDVPPPTARPHEATAAIPSAGLAHHLRELVRPYPVRLVAVGLLVLVAAVLEVVPPLVVRHVIDSDLTRGDTAGLGVAAVLYLAAATGVAAASAAYGYLAATVAQRSLAALRTRLFAHLLALPMSYHDRTPRGESISRATADVDAIDDLFSSSVATLLGEVVRLAAVAVAMIALSPVLAAAAALVVPPLVLITNVLRRRVRDAERATRRAVGTVNAELAEDLAGVEVIRAFGRQRQFDARFRRALHGWLQAGNRSVLFNAFYAPVLGILAAAVTALLLWLGGRDAFAAIGVSIGTLTAFVLLFARFFTPLTNLGDEWQTVQAALAGAERVFAVLELPTDRPATTAPSADPATPGPAPARRPTSRETPAVLLREVPSATNPAGRSSTGWTSPSRPAGTWPSSGAPAPASPPSCRWRPASTSPGAGRSAWPVPTRPGSTTTAAAP